MKNYHLLILDGGMGRELEQMGAPFRQPEWSALALMEAPEYVLQAHRNFINAGCEIITTNTYALVPFHIGAERFISDGRDLINRAAKIAKQATEKLKHDVLIAGCIPPLFGSYRPEAFDEKTADFVLNPLMEEQEFAADVWLVETISSIQEMNTIYEYLIENSSKPVWLSLTLRDEERTDVPLLRSKEPLLNALNALEKYNTMPSAILFNCSQPECIKNALDVTSAWIEGKNIKNMQIGAFANSFVKKEHKPANESITDLREDITPERYLEFAQNWRESGATIIGGCCGIGPEYIRLLSESLK